MRGKDRANLCILCFLAKKQYLTIRKLFVGEFLLFFVSFLIDCSEVGLHS